MEKKQEDKLRILAVSDTHGDMGIMQKLAEKAEKEDVDLVLICGDFTPRKEPDTPPNNMIGPFLKRGKKVFVLHGNNETEASTQFLREVYGLKNLHGYAVKYKGIGIFGCGGAEIGPFPTSEAEIYEMLKKGFDKVSYLKKKIMVTHAHPSGTKMEKLTDFFRGSDSVRNAVEKFQPDVLICGHVHEAEGMEETLGKTKVINVAKSGRIIDI